MAYAKALRVVRVDLASAGEPGYWVEVEHPESMSWSVKRAIIRAGNGAGDELERSTAQVAAMVTAWNLEDRETGEALPLPATEATLDRLPAHVVEAILVEVGALFQIPKASGS